MGIGRLGLVLGGLFSEGVSMLTEQDLRDQLIAIEGVWEVSDVSGLSAGTQYCIIYVTGEEGSEVVGGLSGKVTASDAE